MGGTFTARLSLDGDLRVNEDGRRTSQLKISVSHQVTNRNVVAKTRGGVRRDIVNCIILPYADTFASRKCNCPRRVCEES